MACGECLIESPSGATHLQSSFCSLIRRNIYVVLFMLQFWDVGFNLWFDAFFISKWKLKTETQKQHNHVDVLLLNPIAEFMLWFWLHAALCSYCDPTVVVILLLYRQICV